MANRYRGRPPIVEAMQYIDNREDIKTFVGPDYYELDNEDHTPMVMTEAGPRTILPGWFIVRDHSGTYRTMSAELFHMLYENIDET